MATTRFYFPSGGLAPISPAFAAWSVTTGAGRLAMATTRVSSPMTSFPQTVSTTQTALMNQYVSAPLAAQTIAGNITMQIRAAKAGGSFRLAVNIRVVKPDGTDRGVLAAITTTSLYSGSTLTNRSFLSTALSSVVAVAGDYLVVEVGGQGATTTNAITLSLGDNSATDLPVDTTTTTANNPWMEFDSAILLPISSVTGVSSMTGVQSITF